MDRTEFEKEYNAKVYNRDWNVDMDLLRKIEMDNAHKPITSHNTMVIALEELSELSKEICKIMRGKGSAAGLIEELADVQIMILQLCERFDISEQELNAAINVKLDHYKFHHTT